MHGMFNKSHMSTYLFQMRGVLSRPNWNPTMLFYAGHRATTSYLLRMMHTAQVAPATIKQHKKFSKKCIGTKSCWSMMRLVHVTIHRHRILLRCVLKHERCSRQKKQKSMMIKLTPLARFWRNSAMSTTAFPHFSQPKWGGFLWGCVKKCRWNYCKLFQSTLITLEINVLFFVTYLTV